jgi:hypothetical protein
VIAIVPTADRQKATVRVRIGFLERDERVLRDMGAKVAFLGSETPDEPQQEASGVTVAAAAVRDDASGTFVWRVSDGLVERRTVEVTGSRDRDRVLITRGLAVGDTVVRSAERDLSAGQVVKTE